MDQPTDRVRRRAKPAGRARTAVSAETVTSSISTTEVVVRNSLKVLMAALALVGITGMYLSQVRRNGLLGLVGYLMFGICYLVIMSTTFVAAYVLPSIAGTDTAYVNDVIAASTGGTATGDIGLLQYAFRVQDIAYLAGGLVFGIALFRAGVLARWAAALLALGGLVSVGLSLMPDAFYRLLAFPNGIALIGLGFSLWSTARKDRTRPRPRPWSTAPWSSASSRSPRGATCGATTYAPAETAGDDRWR